MLEELLAREAIFHHPPAGTPRAALDALLDPAFEEIGASGRLCGREEALAILVERAGRPDPAQRSIRDAASREIAPGLHLLTYTLATPDRVTRRASLWRRTPDGWRIVHHRGTVSADGS